MRGNKWGFHFTRPAFHQIPYFQFSRIFEPIKSSLSKYNRKLNNHGLFWLVWISNILTRIKENLIIIYHPYGTWLVFFFLCYIQEGNCLSNHHALVAHIHPLLFANSLVAATKTWKWKEIVHTTWRGKHPYYVPSLSKVRPPSDFKTNLLLQAAIFHQMILLSFKFHVFRPRT